MAAPPRPPDVPVRPGPPVGWKGVGAGITLGPYSQTYAPPPPPAMPPSRMVPGGIPGQPIYFQLPPPSANDPYPGYISPADAHMEALKEAAMYSQPALNELRRQQKMVHDRNVAELAGIMAITKLLTGSGGPEGQIQGFEGQQRYLQAVQQGNADEQDVAGKIQELLSGEPEKAQSILADLLKEQSGLASDYQSAHKPVIRSLQGGLWGYDPSNPTKGGWIVPPPGQAGKPPKTISGPDGLYAWNQEKNGDWSLVPIGPRKSAAAKPPKTISGPDGLYSWQQTKDGWNLVPVGPRKTSASAGPDYQHTVINGKAYVFDKNSGTFYEPGTMQPVVPGNSPPKGVTATTIAKGWKLINTYKGPIWTREGDTQPLTTSQIRGIIGDWNSHAKEFNKTAKKEDRLPTLTLADLANLSTEQAAELGLSKTQLRPDEIYLKLVREVGVPSRRAWQMVRRIYPSWGKGYYRPKADAAPDAAAGFGDRLVTFAKQQLGQPYVWGAESRKEGGFDCSGLVDWSLRQEGYTGPRVTTYTLRGMGQHVVRKNIQPGDLIITNNGKHVVIYAGDGKVIAGSSAQGRVVMQPLSGITVNEIRRLGPQQQGGGSRTLAGVQGPTPAARVVGINSFLKQQGSPMAGLGNIFVAAGKKYGVDPALLVAISGAESSFGTYGPIQSIHNPFGWGPGISFPSWQAAIYRIARGLRDGYLRKGLTSIEAIANKWAPPGAGNDPNNLNANWVANVRKYYAALTGSYQ